MQRLCRYWMEEHDWSQKQAWKNKLPDSRVQVNGLSTHFLHLRGSNNSNLPVLLLHGWPYSFHSFHEMAERLAQSEKFGGNASYGRDVIIPSMPGYGFSSGRARHSCGHVCRADGEDPRLPRYLAHGGDCGSYVAEMLGFHHGDHCVEIRLTMISFRHRSASPKSINVPPDANDEERAFAEDELRLWTPESAYGRLQS